jgi:hypothetical protein
MKKIFSAIIAILLATSLQAAIIRTTVNLPFGNSTIKVEVVLNTDGNVATIGTGYNACIPQYAEGKLHIPSIITHNNTTYTVTAIAPVAFRFCVNLEEVEIDEGVTTIGNFAFVGCKNIEAISLPSTVTTIGGGAFCKLPNLKEIKCAATTPPTWRWYDVFQVDGSTEGRNPDLKLYVPESSTSAYQAAKNDYSWTCMNTSTTPYTWGATETRSQIGWGSYFNVIRSLEQWDVDHSISIYTVDDLINFRNKVNSGTTYYNYVVKLEADLDLSGVTWTPIGHVNEDNDNKYYDFYGTFDGQGHTISYLSVGTDASYTDSDGHNNGLFGGTRNATVKNLIMDNATIKGNWHVGTVIAHAQGATTVENVLVKNCNVTGRCFAGGIIGTAEDYSSDDCVLRMNGCVVKGGSVTSVFNVCYDGDIPFCVNHPSWGAAGGLIGFANYARFTNCANIETKVTWSGIIAASEDREDIDRQVCRGTLVGYQEKDYNGMNSLAYCYVLRHSKNRLTRKDYVMSDNIQYLDSDTLYGNPLKNTQINQNNHWSYSADSVAVGNNDSNLKGMQLQTTLNTNNPGQWAYKYNELPWPGYFAYYAYGDTDANKVVYMPYNVFVDKPNYLTVDNASSVRYNDENNTFTAHSIAIDNNFSVLYYTEETLPISERQITVTNGVINPITLSAQSNGTQQVTTEYPIYVKDENNMLVLDPHGNPVQAVNLDGSPKTESLTETVTSYTPKSYTLYLPYSITLTGNCEVYEPTTWDASAGKLNFERVENNLVQAYKPYYVVVKEGEVSLNAHGENLIARHGSDQSATQDNAFYTIGLLYNMSAGTVQYNYVLDNNQWRYVSDHWTTLSVFNFYINNNNANPGSTFGINLIDNTVINLAVTGYGDSENSGWKFISSPIAGSITPSEVENLEGWKVQTGLYNYDLYRLDPSEDLPWQNYHNHDTDANPFNLINGQGYLYATKTDRTLSFRGTFNTDATKDVSLKQGFNLVGNPFNVPAYVNRSYYKMNAAGSDIEAVNEYATNTIPVCTGIVVKAEANNETVRFSQEAPVAMAQSNGSLQMTLARAGLRSDAIQDNAIVSFDEGVQLEKFIFNESHAKLYFTQNGKDYAIVSAETHGDIPVNFKARENGEFTLTISSPLNSNLSTLTYLHLIDNLTGTDIDLLTTPSYTFTARNDDYESRFRLVFVANDADLGGEGNDDFAFISNGQFIITSEGTLQIIDMMGRVIVTKQLSTTNSQLPTANFKAGVYVLRLVNGDNIKTQKIVIK